MKMTKKAVGEGVAYARKGAYEYEGTQYEADIQDGDVVVIMDAGKIESGQYGDEHVFRVGTRNGEKKARFNQSSINVLVDAFGEESEAWVGKKVNVLTKKGVFGGNKSIAAYFVTSDWELDEFGDLVKKGSTELSEDDIPFNG